MRDPPAVLPLFALVVAAAMLVAFASSGSPLWTLVREGRADRLVLLVDLTVLGTVGLVAAFAATVVVHRALVARRPEAPALPATLLRALPFTTAALAVLSLLVIARTDLGRVVDTDEGRGHLVEESDRRALPLTITGWFTPQVRAGDGERDQEELRDGADQGDGLPLLVLVLGGLGLVLTGVAWRWYAGASPSPGEPADEHAVMPGAGAVHGTVTGTIDAMLADPDPNTAIRGAYARLLEGLEETGSGRELHEGPTEYLQRVLTTLRVRPEPLRRLTALFQLARFSTRPLSTGHREEALAALRDVAADLSSPMAR